MQDTPHENAQPPTTDSPEPHGVPTGRVMHIVYTFAIAAAVMGLYFGVRYQSEDIPPPTASRTEHTQAHIEPGVYPSLTYTQVSEQQLGPNAGWRSALPEQPGVEAFWQYVQDASDQDRFNAAASMAERRAFHGAPPTIPHAIDPIEHISCVSCHGPNGMRLADEVVASPMPHPHYASCTQCHVPEQALVGDETRWLANHFAGLPEPTAGERAWEGAPPTIPHATHMRTSCISCHGPNGESGLKSTHPWRTSCTQCHAPSGRLDQQPGAGQLQELFQQYDLPADDE